MKRSIIIVSLLLFNGFIFAQKSIETTVGAFKELKVYDRIEVELIKSDIDKVIISGKNTEDVVIVNKSKTLKIRMTLPKLFDGNETTVQVYYTSLDVIDANEGTYISSNDIFEQFELDIKAQEGGSVRLQVKDLTFLNIKAATGGTIEVSGNTKNQSIDINTGGIYKGADVITHKTEVVIKAAGEAHVQAEDTVEAKVRAGGTVYVYGNPKTLDEDTVLGGKIVRKD